MEPSWGQHERQQVLSGRKSSRSKEREEGLRCYIRKSVEKNKKTHKNDATHTLKQGGRNAGDKSMGRGKGDG